MKNRFQLFLWICLSLLAIRTDIAYSNGSDIIASHKFVDGSIFSEKASDTPFLLAQVVNPADKQKKPEQEETAEGGQHLRSWELPPVTVTGKRELREEEHIGAYAQPRWTAHRRFTETRVYVRPKGDFDFEYWLIPERSRDGEWGVETQYEWEMGLPQRFQLDLYLVTAQAENKGALELAEQKVELRWALADWGKIPANPTLYLERVGVSGAPDHIEGKLLLGGEIAPRWHLGVNYVLEHETAGEQENSNELTAGLSYTALDEKLSLGAEVKLALVDTKADRGNFSKELLIGPSIQYRPLPPMHLDIVPLLGVTDDSPRLKTLIVTGWEF